MPTIEKRIDVALGNAEADLVIRNARIFHLTTGDFETADIAISDGMIVAVGTGYKGLCECDATGLTAVPGFIDAHVHVESSLMAPAEYEKMVLRHGVTTVFCDPHELANVVGTRAFEFFAEASRFLSLDMRVRLSSCVPSTHLETAGAEVTSQDLKEWKEKLPQAGLAEFMNVPGVLFKDREVLSKIALFDYIDGHAPLLSGNGLNAYIAAGVKNDHECSNLDEAREKLRRGMKILIREGSVAQQLNALLPLLTLENSMNVAFCTDDRNPFDIKVLGHIDAMISRAIAAGVSPLVAYRAASYASAQIMGLNDRGVIAPGKRADIVLLSDFEDCKIQNVFANGRLVCDEMFAAKPSQDLKPFENTVKCRSVTKDNFAMPQPTEGAPVIGIIEHSLITEYLKAPMDDIALISVLERHGKNGNISKAYVHGFKLKKGAIASSVGHDSHNICVVGASPDDMAVAVNALRDAQGGFTVAIDGKVAAMLPLPVAGLMSDQDEETVISQLTALRNAARETGCTLDDPFMQLAFIPLPVIPFLKLTDKGLVDVQAFKLI